MSASLFRHISSHFLLHKSLFVSLFVYNLSFLFLFFLLCVCVCVLAFLFCKCSKYSYLFIYDKNYRTPITGRLECMKKKPQQLFSFKPPQETVWDTQLTAETSTKGIDVPMCLSSSSFLLHIQGLDFSRDASGDLNKTKEMLLMGNNPESWMTSLEPPLLLVRESQLHAMATN